MVRRRHESQAANLFEAATNGRDARSPSATGKMPVVPVTDALERGLPIGLISSPLVEETKGKI